MESSTKASENKNPCTVSTSTQCVRYGMSKEPLLATAIIKVVDLKGNLIPCRVLLDNGSQMNFITAELARRVRLPLKDLNISVLGVGKSDTKATSFVSITIKSRFNHFSQAINCVVLPQVTVPLPQESIPLSNIEIPQNIELADEKFYEPAKVDMIIGVALFWDLMCIEQIKLSKNQPTFKKTLFGWVASGVTSANKGGNRVCHVVTNDQLNDTVKKFWELEHGLFFHRHQSPDEKKCEDYYDRTVQRDNSGRFIVKLPIKHDILDQLGETKSIAYRLLLSQEKRLMKNPKIAQQYTQFMQEYVDLGHMREVIESPLDTRKSYYLPHHCVIKESSTTTKLRVVFNASCKSTTNISLNDTLMVGPTLQGDLFSRLLEFRTFEVAFSADIPKMYRQILVDPTQTNLQRILWRRSPKDSVKTYELLTVTYGTSSASYLAIRSVRKVAEDSSETYPIASRVILNHFYVDDLLSGANSVEEAIALKTDILHLLQSGGFDLKKWASNSKELRENGTQKIKEFSEDPEKTNQTRTLGVVWDSAADVFKFTTQNKIQNISRPTKRQVLSKISLLFDPLGLLGPGIMIAKLLMQDLWRSGVQWDDELPNELVSRWKMYEEDITQFLHIDIPRKVYSIKNLSNIQLHGFCDASEAAYGACIYIRSIYTDGSIRTILWCSKSRVAPLKTITVAKLELCAAALLAKLVQRCIPYLNINIDNIFLWSDSKIVLCWLRSCSRAWNTFVANRVGEIQDLTPIENWHHVNTLDNPADPLSRGVMPAKLADKKIWWHGPEWLSEEQSKWPMNEDISIEKEKIPERKSTCTINHACIKKPLFLFTRFSCYLKLVHITAYCLRIKKRASNQKIKLPKQLQVDEIIEANKKLIKFAQNESFSAEISSIKSVGSVNKQSSILKLTPFLDADGILRVGGRLKNSSLPFDAKHPILLPSKHPFTRLLIIYEHERSFHAGAYNTLSIIRQKYWPCAGRDVVRAIVKKCVKCFKNAPKTDVPLMGNLPKHRVDIPIRAFAHCGVDFAGPINYKEGERRNSKLRKSYIAIFACFATKAMHIELTIDLSAETFLNVLRRFIARRGRPTDIYSDNATNFVGTEHDLHSLHEMFTTECENSKIINFCANEQIQWHFIPPRAPNFGGLWEAAVKSAKISLRHVVGESSLRYDELTTLLTQVEAILNSRPLSPLSEDPNDLQPLTPAHFLIGMPLTSFPEPSILHILQNRLTRWQRVEPMRQQFWKRWTTEYLHTLQQRKNGLLGTKFN